MAGGKESPRQKMIGMMYLVLTALLALNVSNAVLEKFAVLNNTLGDLREEATDVNSKSVAGIVGASTKTPKVDAAKKAAQDIHAATLDVITKLDAVKEELKKGHDGVVMGDEELILNTNIAEEKILNARDPKFGKDMHALLTNYSSTLTGLTQNKIKFAKLDKVAEDYEEFKDNEHHKGKDFLHFMFEGTPTMAAITTITQLQNEILENEAIALDTIAKIADIGIMKVDNYVPMVIPESDIVAAGAKYKARMFVAASSSGLIPTMKRDGAPVPVAKDSDTQIQMGTVEFTAVGGNYVNDIAEKSFKAEITLKNPDTTITRTIKYKVVKPTIRVVTGNLPQLYYNCGNLVNIEVPSLGTNYNPTFTPAGAQIVAGAKASQITIIPKQNKVTIAVNNGGVLLGSEEFAVKRIPRPHVTKKDQTGKVVDDKNGVKIGGLSSLRITVDPDDTFKENVPKDAIYRVKNMEVILKRGVTAVTTMTVTSEVIDLTAWKAQMRPGDVILCNIKQVIRRTFLNEEEKVDFNEYVFVQLQ